MFKVISFFDNNKEDELTWAEALFNDGNVKLYGKNADGMENWRERTHKCEEM
jgi:hypothetical protein